MTCMTAFAESMATTQLARVTQDRVIQYEDAAPWRLESNGKRIPRMSWVVVTGKDGGRKLRIQWETGMEN
ncbi:MAG: hypothetical protein ABSD76_13210 [Terriglobales bacterium]|jgi:hypothetical protein